MVVVVTAAAASAEAAAAAAARRGTPAGDAAEHTGCGWPPPRWPRLSSWSTRHHCSPFYLSCKLEQTGRIFTCTRGNEGEYCIPMHVFEVLYPNACPRTDRVFLGPLCGCPRSCGRDPPPPPPPPSSPHPPSCRCLSSIPFSLILSSATSPSPRVTPAPFSRPLYRKPAAAGGTGRASHGASWRRAPSFPPPPFWARGYSTW